MNLSYLLEEKTSRSVKFYLYGSFFLLLSLFTFYLAYEATIDDDFSLFMAGGIFLLAVSFLFFSPWKRLNSLIGATIVSCIGFWMLNTFDYKNEFILSFIWTVVITLWAAALFAHAFGKTLTGTLKSFFQLSAVRGTASAFVGFMKFLSIVAAFTLVAWLIVAIGPLWIIAIILLMILLVVSEK